MQTQTSPAEAEFFLLVSVFNCFQSMLLFEQVQSLSHEVLVFFLPGRRVLALALNGRKSIIFNISKYKWRVVHCSKWTVHTITNVVAAP